MEEEEVRKPPRKSTGEFLSLPLRSENNADPLHLAEKRQHVVNTGAIASRSRRSRQSLQNIAAAATTTKRTAPKASSSASPPPHARPAPAPPATSSPQHARSSPRAPRPLPTAPGSSAAGTPSSRVPQIHLQSATPDTIPQTGLQPNALPLPPSTQSSPLANSGGWESAPPSPSPAQQANFDSVSQHHQPQPIVTSGYVPPASPAPTFESTAGGAPVLPIHIPQTGDAAMQQFFHDIVGQLQTISLRNSLPPSPMGSPVMGFRGDSYLGGGGGSVGGRDSVMSNGSAARTTPLPEIGGAGDQFEDAEEDDESDAGYEAASSSVMSGSMRGPTPSYDINNQDPFRITYQPHRSTSPSSPVRPLSATSPIGPGPPLIRPRIAMRGSSREPSRPSSRNDYASGDKENRAAPPPASSGAGRRIPPPLAPRPTASAAQAGKERATLGLAIQSAGVPSFEYEMIEMPDSPTALKGHGNGYAHGGQKRMTMKKKREFRAISQRGADGERN